MIDEPFGEIAAEAMAEVGRVVEMGQPAPAGADETGTEVVGTLSLTDGAPGGAGGEASDGAEGSEGSESEGTAEAKPPAKPSARFLTITVVLVTFVAALGGFLLNRASAAASNAADVAQELSLQASAAETSAYRQAESDYSQYLSLQSLRASAAQQMLEATYNQEGTQTWASLYRVTSAQAAQTAALVPHDLRPNLANGDPDPNFPYDFFAQRATPGTVLDAKSDAYNDVSNRWSGLVDSYTAILTMIAVALFLFGSAFVLYGRNRILFTALGATLVATGLVWGGGLALTREPTTPSTAAAVDYANGVTAMEEASAPAGYHAAIQDFTAAIKLRPDYALAYSERAAAEAFRGSEAVGGGFVSVTNVSPYWARLTSEDEVEAYNLGDHDASQVLNVGWGYYALWLVDGGVGRPPVFADRYFDEAAGLDPTNPIPQLDLGVAELASGQYAAAARAYSAGVTLMLFTCRTPGDLSTCNRPQPTTSFGLQHAWVAGAMESLEALAQTKEGAASSTLRAEISKMEGVVAGSMGAGAVVAGPSGQRVSAPGLSAFLDPNYLELDVTVPASMSPIEIVDSPLTVLWYQRPNISAKWTGIYETACWGHGQQNCGTYDAQTSTIRFVTRLLAAADQCFTNVEYKAEVWLKGSLVGSLSLNPHDDYISTNLAPALAKAMNVGICVPSSWRLQAAHPVTLSVYGTKEKVSGPLSTSEMSYAAADHSKGVYLFRLYPPRSTPGGGQLSMQDVVQAAETYAIDILRGRGLPADIAPLGATRSTAIWGGAVSDMVVTAYSSPSTHTEAFVGAAIIAPQGTQSQLADQDNSIAANVTGDYAVAVTIVYGPRDSGLWKGGDHSLGVQIFSSWSLLNYG